LRGARRWAPTPQASAGGFKSTYQAGALRRRLPRSASPQDYLPTRTTHSLLPVRRRLPRVTAPIPLLVAPQTSSKSRADLGLLCASPELAHAVFGLPTIGRPSQVAVVGDDSPTTTTRRPTTVDDAFVSGCAIPSCPCPCPHTHALSNHRDTVTPRMYLVGHPSKVVVWLGLMRVYHLHSLATLPLAASCHSAPC
jgi:hypothetical protein